MLNAVPCVQELNMSKYGEIMVHEEFDILNIVADNPFTSQRQIARQAGISLGQVNFLMKKFATKGLIKIEGQTTKSLQYHLTPKGMAAVAEKTLRYMKNSYSAVRDMINSITGIAREYDRAGYSIYISGSRDEMMELCILALNDGRLSYQIGNPPAGTDKALIFCWEQEVEDKLQAFTCVNLLKLKG